VKSLGNFPDPFAEEIAGQPGALRRAAESVAEQLSAITDAAHADRRLTFCGMGSSYDACYPAVTALARDGIPALMLDAAELLHFRLPMLGPDDTLVLVSQSGESAEVVRAAERLRSERRRPQIVSITNGSANTLVGLADIALDTRAGHETGPSTMTFAASLVVLGAFVLERTGVADVAGNVRADAEAAARAVQALVDDPALPDALGTWHGGRTATVILGRGSARAAAEMGALTLKEVLGIPVESLQAAQFRHGPLELAGPDLAAIVLATEPPTVDLDLRLARDLAAHGSAVAVVTAEVGAPSHGEPVIDIGRLDPLVAAAAAIVPIQLLAWRLAPARGRVPGSYVHAAKVTTSE
jgi:glucosamine--fructose-6-phosphate aminotransferase (isomerizing)